MNSFASFLLGILLALLTSTSCMRMRTSPKVFYKKFKSNTSILASSRVIFFVNRSLHYFHVKKFDQKERPLIVFIHGAPGSADAFMKYLKDTELQDKYDMVSIDRLGYGYSDFGKSEKSIIVQSDAVLKLIEDLPNREVITVGHSYGGPIALYVATQLEKVRIGLLLAPTLDPKYEKVFKISYLGKWKTTRWILPKPFQVAADEKFSHAQALLELNQTYTKTSFDSLKVVHIHGTKDMLVPYNNIYFLDTWMESPQLEKITLEKVNHFIPWTHFELIKKTLLLHVED